MHDNMEPSVPSDFAGESAEVTTASTSRNSRQYLRQGDNVYALNKRNLRKVLALVARGEPVDLAQWGTLLGAAPDIASLARKSAQQALSAPTGVGRKPTTGRFATRQELLERVWFYRLYTKLSDAAIADNVKVSPGVVSAILRSDEGKPENPPVQEGFRAQQFRGRQG